MRQDSISQGAKHCELSLVQREQKAQASSTRGPGAGTAGQGWRGSIPFWSFSWNKSAQFGESGETKPGWLLIPFQKGKPNYILCVPKKQQGIGRSFSCFLERGKKVQPHYCDSCGKLARIISHHLKKNTPLFCIVHILQMRILELQNASHMPNVRGSGSSLDPRPSNSWASVPTIRAQWFPKLSLRGKCFPLKAKPPGSLQRANSQGS